jgi:hypothetical protein
MVMEWDGGEEEEVRPSQLKEVGNVVVAFVSQKWSEYFFLEDVDTEVDNAADYEDKDDYISHLMASFLILGQSLDRWSKSVVTGARSPLGKKR